MLSRRERLGIGLGGLLLGGLLLRRLLPDGLSVGAIAVAGDSMRPTLRPGDACLVRYGARIRVGHLVVARLPHRPLGVKRAVLHDEDGWYLVSDDPLHGTDSATFGSVPDDDILGRVLLRYWPRPAWFSADQLDGGDPADPARRRRS